MSKIEPGTPLEDVYCPKCNDLITAYVGHQRGNNIVGECRGRLPSGRRCDVRFTYGKNASYETKQEFLNQTEAANASDEEETSTSEPEADLASTQTQDESVQETEHQQRADNSGSDATGGATSERNGDDNGSDADGADSPASRADKRAGDRNGGSIFPI